jgi:hypothetical protein
MALRCSCLVGHLPLIDSREFDRSEGLGWDGMGFGWDGMG